MQAGFAEIEITPPLGTRKIGWLREITGEKVLDPLFARAAVLESGGQRIAWVQLDTLCARWALVNAIRRRVAERHDFPGERIMVCATHNHAGPAVAQAGEVARDGAYVESLVERVVRVFGQALEKRAEAEAGFGRGVEFRVSHNRRVVMRDGTVKTHGHFRDPDALCLEGPIDPEVGVLAFRAVDGAPLGVLVNFACHPAHHGGDTSFSAGWPGVLASELKARDWPVTLFLNGAQGNIATSDPRADGADPGMETVGRTLAENVGSVLKDLAFRPECKLAARRKTIELPFRRITEDELRGTVRGAQRFIDPKIYDRCIPALLEKIRARGKQRAEVQMFGLDEYALVGIPAELFVQLGLRIKEGAHPRHAWVAGLANGMVGYVPHRAAFTRGGYETTFMSSSKLAPEAGDRLVEAALDLCRQEEGK